jgi:tetratricopeptide (TPR) repeat protein
MIKTSLAICFLGMACLCGCSAMFAKTSQLSMSHGTVGTPPEHGLRVMRVFPDSQAEAAGLQQPDLITQYGEFEIVDDAGYFAARNHYDEAHVPTVEIVVWRGRNRLTAKVRSGWLGIDTRENDKVSQAFFSLMDHMNAMLLIPKYQHDREFKGAFTEEPAQIVEKAKALIDQAEREGTLTSAQILVDRIYMTLDDAPIEDQKRQAVLLQQLIATQPVNYLHMLGNDKFFSDKRYRAAIPCFEQYLKTFSDDVSERLDLGLAYNEVGMYAEAERSANYVFDHKLGLSTKGQYVAYTVKAAAALGLKDYPSSIQFAEKAFSVDPKVYPLMIVQLAAAQMGDIRRVEEAMHKLQRVLPENYLKMKLEIDAGNAYALVKANQPEAARRLVKQSKDLDRTEGRVTHYWRIMPDGMDVARNWADLMQN